MTNPTRGGQHDTSGDWPKDETDMSRFKGKLVLVFLEGKDRPTIRGGRALWGVQRELSYRTGGATADAEELITVPAGFVTDLASIPRAVWSFYPPDGPWAKAAIIHDFLYFTKGSGEWHGRIGVSRGRAYSRSEADAILKEGMADRDVGKWEQFVIWASVRLGGGRGWGT